MTEYICNRSEVEDNNVQINVLPVTVDFTGTVCNGSNTWAEYSEKEGQHDINYLRGHRLVGDHYAQSQVLLFEKGDANNYNAIAKSNGITLYEHEVAANTEDNQLQRMNEWVNITNFINQNDECGDDININ